LADVDIILGTIDDANMPRFLDGVSGHFGYRETLPTGDPNPETKTQYSRRKLQQQVKGWIRRYERQQAIDEIVTPEIEIT